MNDTDTWLAELDKKTAERDELRARVAQLEDALNAVLIKVDWNSDEFHDSKQYNETRGIILSALSSSPSEALAAIRVVMEVLSDLRQPEWIYKAEKALAALKKVFGAL